MAWFSFPGLDDNYTSAESSKESEINKDKCSQYKVKEVRLHYGT